MFAQKARKLFLKEMQYRLSSSCKTSTYHIAYLVQANKYIFKFNIISKFNVQSWVNVYDRLGVVQSALIYFAAEYELHLLTRKSNSDISSSL